MEDRKINNQAVIAASMFYSTGLSTMNKQMEMEYEASRGKREFKSILNNSQKSKRKKKNNQAKKSRRANRKK